MSDQIQVSAWSIRHRLGDAGAPFRNAVGRMERRPSSGLADLELSDLPRHLRHTFGVGGMEIPDWVLDRAGREQRRSFRSSLAAEEMVLGNVTIDACCVGEANPQHRAEDFVELERLFGVAADAGAQAVRVNIVPPPIIEGGGVAEFGVIVEGLSALLQRAEALEMRLLIENHCELTDTKAKIERLLGAVGPGLGLILDTGNIEPIQTEVLRGFRTGEPVEDLDDTEAAFDFVEDVLPLAELVHVKTYGFRDSGRPALYDQERAVRLISDSGYAGPITIECMAPPAKVYEAISRSVAMVRGARGEVSV